MAIFTLLVKGDSPHQWLQQVELALGTYQYTPNFCITAFKSFTVRSEEDVPKWIALLATDLFARIKADFTRNSRFPTMCTVQYYYCQEGELSKVLNNEGKIFIIF